MHGHKSRRRRDPRSCPLGKGQHLSGPEEDVLAAVSDGVNFRRSAVVWAKKMDGDVAGMVEACMQAVCLSQPARAVQQGLEPKRGRARWDALACLQCALIRDVSHRSR
jgi:hypothetical protein